MEFTDDGGGEGRAARNKGNIKSGGLTVKQVVDKFADHPNKELKKSFSQALRAFEKVVQSFPREKQVEIFGPDTNIYYNAEIINPDTPNVINYDKKLVTLHRGGGGFFDKETGSAEEVEGRDPETGELVVKERDVSANAEILAQALEGILQDMESQGGFEVIMDAIQTLQGLDDKAALNKAMADLDAKISAEGISDNQMIVEYIMARILTILKERGVNLNPETESLVLKRLLLQNKVYRTAWGYDKIPSELQPRKMLKDLHDRDKNKVIDILNNSKDILKQAIQPIESVVHDFSVAMLAGLESLFILDNKKGIEKIKDKVRVAKEKIESEKSEEDIKILLQQMEKLKSIENISTAAEGFVFDYDGYTYKFTGNFAPINQILGIGKYEGRGTLPPLETAETPRDPREPSLAVKGRMKLGAGPAGHGINENDLIQEVMNILLKERKDLDVIYLPGGFKPPHKGHWSMIQRAAEKYPGVPIRIISGMASRDGVTLEDAEKIWNIYINKSELDDIRLINFTKDRARNPWHWIGENAPESFGVVYSEKDKQYERIVTELGGEPIVISVCQDEDRSCSLSATNFRDALNDKTFFKTFIPDHVTEEDKDTIWNILGGSEEEEIQVNIRESIFSIIEEVLEEEAVKRSCEKITGESGNCAIIDHETGKQKACYDTCSDAYGVGALEEEELDEMASMGGGAAALGAGNAKRPKDERPKLKGSIRGIKITYERRERN